MTTLPYGRQWVVEEDIRAVTEVLQSEWLTTGPMVGEFEKAFSEVIGAEAVAVNSGTAALHAAMFAIGVGEGDEVIVPAITFPATANAAVYQGGRPVFADVDPDTLLVSPSDIARKITPKTKAIVAVDYAGQPCDYGELRELASRHDLWLVADACHSLGASYRGNAIGSVADVTAFSFHPVKHITTCEGGMLATSHRDLSDRARMFRNHGIAGDFRQREKKGTWYYEMTDLGFNYRLSDLHCALGLSQLKRLKPWVERRRAIAQRYDEIFSSSEGIRPLAKKGDRVHSYHLYVIQLDPGRDRTEVFQKLRACNIGVNVHYLPVYLHPFYRDRYATHRGLCPQAEAAYERILSLPLFPKMTDADVERVIAAVQAAVGVKLGKLTA